jgi:homoserine dehydrogenase
MQEVIEMKTSRSSSVPVTVVGTGNVGKQLLLRLIDRPPFSVIAVCNLEGSVINTGGFSAEEIRRFLYNDQLDSFDGAQSHKTADQIGNELAAANNNRPVIVADVTADDLGQEHLSWLKLGFRVATANKKPVTDTQWLWNKLMAFGPSRYRFECTCGAGLPVISSIRDLLAVGDKILSIRAAASGSLGHIMCDCERHKFLSSRDIGQAILHAKKSGYTEPDPRDDLSCMDLARKALILSRLIGHQLELDDIAVESLVPPPLRKIPLDLFLERLQEGRGLDDLRAEFAEARRCGQKLRCLFEMRSCDDRKRHGIKVGVQALPADDSIAGLSYAENLFVIKSDLYDSLVLKVGGPGAGRGVTAAGVLADMLHLAASM